MTFTYSAVIVLGQSVQTGSYLLRINIAEPVTITFGQFNEGQPVLLPAGSYLYIGSAMGNKGASSLAYRLRRHTLRSDPKNPHDIQPIFIEQAQQAGLNLPPSSAKQHKTCFWHIDYLLDHPQVDLNQIIAIRSSQRRESCLARWLEQMPETGVVVKGLGASDSTGQTHLLRINANITWWANLPTKCLTFIAEKSQL